MAWALLASAFIGSLLGGLPGLATVGLGIAAGLILLLAVWRREWEVPLHAIETVRMLLDQIGQTDVAQLESVLHDPRLFERLVTQAVQGGPDAGHTPPDLPPPPPVPAPPEPDPAQVAAQQAAAKPAPPAPPPVVNVTVPEPKKKSVRVIRDAKNQIIGYEEVG